MPPPLEGEELGGDRGAAHSGVVDKDVDATERLHHGPNESTAVVAGGHVTTDGRDSFEPFRESFESVLPAGGGHHRRSRSVENLGEHFVDPEQGEPHFGDTFSGEFAQEGSSYGGFNPEFAAVVSERLWDLRDGRIEEMDAAGIDIAVLSHTIGGVEGIPDPTLAVRTARRVNDFLAAEVAASGGRFAGFATVALQDVDGAVEELKRAVGDLGLCGVMVKPPRGGDHRAVRSPQN